MKSLGTFQKSFGTKGYIRTRLSEEDLHGLADHNYVFLDIQGSIVPFGIEDLDIEKELIKLEWLDSPEEVDAITPVNVFIPKTGSDLKSEDAIQADGLEGFLLFDQKKIQLGYIIRVEAYPHQNILIVDYNDTEILIPFHENLVIDLQIDKKKLVYSIADGLIDINAK